MSTFALFDCNEQVLPFMQRHLGYEFSPPCYSIGFFRADTLVAGVVLNGYTGSNVDLSLACPGEMSLRIVRTTASFVFRDLGCLRVTARTRRGNRALTRGMPKIGFTFEGVQKQYYGPGRANDAIQFGMLAEQARRLMYHGQLRR